MSIDLKIFPDIRAVPYNDLRSTIRTGDILLCSGNGLFSKFIKRATDSIWSHVAFILRVPSLNRIMLFESVETVGVRTVPLSSYICNYNSSRKSYDGKILIARHAEFDLSKIRDLSHKAVDLLGYPYDFFEIAKISARLLMRWAKFLPKSMEDNGSYICSEYAFECYKSIGVDINHDRLGFVTPRDFAATPKIYAVGVPLLE